MFLHTPFTEKMKAKAKACHATVIGAFRVTASRDYPSCFNAIFLIKKQVTIRHGDRSAIHGLPGAYEQQWQCQPYSEEIDRIWRGGVDR